MAPALVDLSTDLGIDSQFEGSLVLSIFILAYAFGPFVLGPLSEVYGRARVLQLANVFYLIFNTACGFSKNPGQIFTFRFLAGLGGRSAFTSSLTSKCSNRLTTRSAPYTIGGGVLADCWTADERGRSIGIYTLAPLLGPIIAPIIGGFITEYSTWRWTFWAVSIVDGIVQILGVIFLKESYAPVLLRRKSQMIRKSTGNPNWYTKWDIPDHSDSNAVKLALVRPFMLLGTQPIVQVLALYLAYLYGTMYLFLTTFPALWVGRYHESIGVAGLNYISIGFGFIIGAQSTARANDVIYKYLKARDINKLGRPEFRLPLLIPSSVLVPGGLFWYGWSAQKNLHWIMPNVGIAIYGIGVKIGTQCIQTYVVDAYPLYIASVGAAATFLRSLAGFGFPLFAPSIYDALDFGWGNSLLAFVAIALGTPAPLLLWRYGPYLRARSTYAAGEGP